MPDPTGRVSHLPDMHRGVSWKQPVRAASTANGSIGTAFANGAIMDGVTLATGDRILLKDQTGGTANGIYVVTTGTPTRAFDMDQDATDVTAAAEEVMGAFVYVLQGTTNGGTLWYATNTSAPVLGTTAISFSQWASGGGSGDMTKAVYDVNNDGIVGTASVLDTGEATIYSVEDNVIEVRNKDTNQGTYFLVNPNGQPGSGDTSVHVYYSRQSEGATHELFMGFGANHGANQYLFASADASDTTEPLPILFIMERGVVHAPIIKMDTDSTVLFYKHLRLTEIAAPSTPSSGEGALYPKTDGKLYFKNDGGTEYDLTGGGVSALDDLSDVAITSAGLGDILRHNGSAFVNVDEQFAGRWEVVMTGSGTALAPVTNEEVDDWLYGWVSG